MTPKGPKSNGGFLPVSFPAAALQMLFLLLLRPSAGVRDSVIIGGSGRWKFQYMPDLLQPPASAGMVNCHALATDTDGSIFLAFENDGTEDHCLIRWNSDGTNAQFVSSALCSGALNGLSITREDNQTFLYQTNKQKKISKTTLNGTLVWQHDGNFGQDPQLPYAPTGFATPPNSEYVYLCDGYGSDLVYPFTLSGQFANLSYGGRGTQKGKFMNNHGCSTDGRLVNTIVVSDRGNGRLQFFEYDPTSPNKFQYNASVDLRVALPSVLPSSVHTYPEHNGLAVVADLSGRVVILNSTNHVVSVLEVAQLLAAQGDKHPSDAILLPNGDLVVSTWSPGRVSYWKALG